VKGARTFHSCINAMHAPRPEIYDRPALRRRHHADGFRCKHGLEMDLVQHQGFDELCLCDGRGDLQDRLVCKYRRALRYGINVAAEAEAVEPIKEPRRELAE
jgi:hypothetical protein